MNFWYQNLLYLMIVIATIVIALSLYGRSTPKVHGIFLPNAYQSNESGKKDYGDRHINPGQITVYHNRPAQSSAPLGIVRTNRHLRSNDQSETRQAINQSVQFAEKMAAKANGNALVINKVAQTSADGPLKAVMLSAEVIHVKRNE